MHRPTRRTFLRTLGAAAGAALVHGPLGQALADPALGETRVPEGEFFVFIHAAGGWDVTLWSDPRNERRGLIEPASTDNTDTAGIRRWVDAPLDPDTRTFTPVRPPGSNLVLGPAIGDLGDLTDRLCIINGLAMNTVSHPDGTVFAASGRHLAGGSVVAPSIDTAVANEFGREQLLPLVSFQYPSSFVGDGLDRRVTPLRVNTVDSIGRVLARSERFDTSADRDAVTAMLSQEAADLAGRSWDPGAWRGMELQLTALRRMLHGDLRDVFDARALVRLWPAFDYRSRYQGPGAVRAAFAVEAMRRNLVKCVSFSLGGLDTHNGNYRTHAANLQAIFDLVATLIRSLDATNHPTLANTRLSEHTHILVVSEFCRTPQVNLAMGRDHYPNNSALVISPRFRGNTVFGRTDVEQLLPSATEGFVGGPRSIAPPDLLATFLAAFNVPPRRYLRDGEVVREILRA